MTIAVIGCGRTGSRLAPHLLKAGITTLALIDRDYLEPADQRDSPAYKNAPLYSPKAEYLAQILAKQFPATTITAHADDLNPANASELLSHASILADCTDNWNTRCLIAEYAWKKSLPWVFAGALATRAMCSTLLPCSRPCWKCWNPEPASPPAACSEAGVDSRALDAVSRVQANEILSLATKKAPRLAGKLWFYDAKTDKELAAPLKTKPDCSLCAKHEFPRLNQRKTPASTQLCGGNHYQSLPPKKLEGTPPAEIRRRLASLKPIPRGSLVEVHARNSSAIIFPTGRVITRAKDKNAAEALNQLIQAKLAR